MKKTIAITLAAITILMLTISACFADPIDWKDSTYSFKGKNTVAIYELDFNKVNLNYSLLTLMAFEEGDSHFKENRLLP